MGNEVKDYLNEKMPKQSLRMRKAQKRSHKTPTQLKEPSIELLQPQIPRVNNFLGGKTFLQIFPCVKEKYK